MSWLNWSLKLHSSLWTIPHLILTHNTQDFVQTMLISFMWLYMFKCDVYAQVLADQTQKDFWVFYMFFKVILYLCAFSFCSKFIFVFFFKNSFKSCFVRSSRLRASRKMCLREIKKSHFHIECLAISSRVFATKIFSRNGFRQKLEIFQFHRKAIAIVSQLFRN